MRSTEFRKYIDLINEATDCDQSSGVLNRNRHTRVTETHQISKITARYMDRTDRPQHCGACSMFRVPHSCTLVEGTISPGGVCRYFKSKASIDEKWDTETKVAPEERGKYTGKSKAELLKMYNALKASGPHKQGSKEFGRMRELAFAIRAKGGWGKVKDEE